MYKLLYLVLKAGGLMDSIDKSTILIPYQSSGTVMVCPIIWKLNKFEMLILNLLNFNKFCEKIHILFYSEFIFFKSEFITKNW